MKIAALPPITAADRDIALLCRDCGVVFISTDEHRTYCDVCMCERINGAGILEDDDDDLFTERTLVCGGCGEEFITTNPRQGARCALCNAGLKVKVMCPVCDLEHVVPILSDTKLCGPCALDPVMTAAALRARLDAAQCRTDEAWLRLDADLAHADAADRARYDAACERAAEWDAARWAKARDAAIAKGDGLSPLLAARLAWDEAATTLDQERAAVELGLEEVTRL